VADFERRLRRLEEQAAIGRTDVEDPLLEMCRKRTAELLSSPEVMVMGPMEPDPEFHTRFEEFAAEAMRACPPGVFQTKR